MRFMLDTNICIYVIKKKPLDVFQKFSEYPVGEIGLSSVTVAGLFLGVLKSQNPEKNQSALEDFLLPLTILDFDYNSAMVYGAIRATLEKQGTLIGPLDMLITAHAKSQDITLVTNNTREFARVPELKFENWISD